MIRPEDLADEPGWEPAARAVQPAQPTRGPSSPAGQVLQSLLAGGPAAQQQYVRFEAAQPVIPPGATGEARRARVMDFLGIQREGAQEEHEQERAARREKLVAVAMERMGVEDGEGDSADLKLRISLGCVDGEAEAGEPRDAELGQAQEPGAVPGPEVQGARAEEEHDGPDLGVGAEVAEHPDTGVVGDAKQCVLGSGRDDSRAAAQAPVELPDPAPQWEFLTGVAGTGKTWEMRRRAAEHGTYTLAATTGIAAVNMGSDIVTLNSLLGYFNTEDLEQKSRYGVVESRLVRLHGSGMRRLVIDEVSMMDGRQLELLLASFDIVNQSLEQTDREPLSLTLTGDFLQLPPVGVNDKNSKVQYAFEAPQWDRFETTRLTEIRRQADRDFCIALGAARSGQARAVTQYFQPCCRGFIDKAFSGTTLFARNSGADKFNAERLGEIQAKPRWLPSTSWGELRGEWKQIPAKLELKVGALVMILANEKEELEDGQRRFVYVNGDLGEVVDFAGPEDGMALPLVKLRRTDRVVTVSYVSRENLVPVDERRKKEILREGRTQMLRDQDRYEAIGGITYCPLRVAYASTIHKAQGLTLDAVQIALNDGFMAKVSGMTYVALTRCRTREGLRIVGTSALLGRRVAAIEERTRRWL